MDYQSFLEQKTQLGGHWGFEPIEIPSFLKDFQTYLVDWAIQKGRAAIFADCGMGKTPMSLVWADNVARHTNKPVLILTPLAVSYQFKREADKFGIEAEISRDGSPKTHITISNYEKLHLFNSADYAGVVCDESGILKNFDGVYRNMITNFMIKTKYRLLCSATPSPNDYVELGNSSESLGELGQIDMLNTFFRNNNNTSDMKGRYKGHGRSRAWEGKQWRFKVHSEMPFWRWVCSWAKALRKPSDLGFSDEGFILPPLIEKEHIVESKILPDGMLIPLPAIGLQEQRKERRRTVSERCEKALSLIESRTDQSIVFCHLNDEGDYLEKIIPHSIQIAGKHDDEYKEIVLKWFIGDECLCGNPLFKDTISSWQKCRTDTIGNTTKKTKKNTANITKTNSQTMSSEKKERNTLESITKKTKKSIRKPKSSSGRLCAGGDIDTQMIQNTDRRQLSQLRQQENEIPIQDSSENSPSMDSQSTNILHSKNSDALSADQNLTKETGETTDSISTMIMTQGSSEVSYAQAATLDSENLRKAQNSWKKHYCICGHQSGKRVLIGKASMIGFGLNLQNCHHIVKFVDHSYESTYQLIRRCWRYGQQYPVEVDTVMTEGDRNVMENLRRKSVAADRMFDNLIACMNDALSIERSSYDTKKMEGPSWL